MSWVVEAYDPEWLQFTVANQYDAEQYFLPRKAPRRITVSLLYKRVDEEQFRRVTAALRADYKRVENVVEKYVPVRTLKAPVMSAVCAARAKWIMYVKLLGKDPKQYRYELFMWYCEKAISRDKCDAIYSELNDLINTPFPS